MSERSDEQDSTTTRLYLAVGRLNRALRRDAKDAAIGHGGLSALATLIEQGPQRAGALADIEGITAPAMTRIVSSLVELGYAERRPDPVDGRAQLVAATSSGTDLVQQKRAVRLRALQERLDRLSDEDRTAVTTALAALEDLTAGPNAD